MELIVIGMGLFFLLGGGIFAVGSKKVGANIPAIVPINTLAAGAYAAVKGKAYSPQPIVSQTTGQQAAFLRREKVEEYEQEVKNVSSRHTRTVESSEQTAPLYINDGTAMLRVDIGTLKPELKKLGESFEQADTVSTAIGFASQLLTTRGRRTLGFRTIESGVLLGEELYGLGKVSAIGNELGLTKDLKLRSAVTCKGEASVKGAEAMKGLVILVIGIGMILVGLLSLAIGIFA